jgi:phosphopantothenate synthetase
MPKPLPTSTPVITDGILRAAAALVVAVYEFKDADIDDMQAMANIESISKAIDRLTRALRKTF